MKRSFAFFLAALVLATTAMAQSPSSRPADPGPLLLDPATGLSLAAGLRVTSLFSVTGLVGNGADMVRGPGNDLFFTRTTGSLCGQPATTDIVRVVMATNDAPVLPLTSSLYTSAPIDAHDMVYDPASGYFFVAGSCNQTQVVYRVAPNGVAQVINPTVPLNDPDGLALGYLPGSSDLKLFVPTLDGFSVFGNLTASLPSLTSIAVDLTAVGLTALGNWSNPWYDVARGTLIGTNVGANSSFKTIEMTFNPQALGTAVALPLSPNRAIPVAADPRGAHLFSRQGLIGYLNSPGNASVFVPIVSGFADDPVFVEAATPGSWFVLDTGNGNVYRIDVPMSANLLELSASAGGTMSFRLDAPAPYGNEGYLVVVGVSGSSPGFTLNNTLITLNYDLLTQFCVDLAFQGSPVLPNWLSFLDGAGRPAGPAPTLTLGPGTALPNFTLTFAFVLGQPYYCSNSTQVHVLP